MISHKHRLIFIHIPKCAGRSISQALDEPFDHYTASYYQSQNADHWNSYTLFTTVRNPYQRLVSMYHYIKNEPFHSSHPITNHGNIIPFKDWVLKNISDFQDEFDYNSPEGNRETDGEWGSPFWFSSQWRRISDIAGNLYSNIHILRYEDGMNAVQHFLQQKNISVNIPHVNRSLDNSRDNYFSYYDQQLLDAVNSFPPFAKDCAQLQYKMVFDANATAAMA